MKSTQLRTESRGESFGPVARYYDTLMSQVPYDEWVDYIHRLWHRHSLAHASLLDIACGTGTVANLLADEGISVYGVDLSAEMLAAARVSNTDQRGIQYFHQDACDLRLPKTDFDSSICLFDSLNYILEPARLQNALKSIASHIKAGGSFIFDVNTEVALKEGMFNQSCSRRGEPLHYRWRARFNSSDSVCTIAMKFCHTADDGTATHFSETHKQRAYSEDDLKAWLTEAGFASVTVYDAYTLDPPKHYSDRLYFVAIKDA